MQNDSFDDLLRALQSALFSAQEALGKKNDEMARRICGGGEGSGSPSAFFTFATGQNAEGHGAQEILRLPSSSFRARRRPQVSMLSMTFECELLETRFPPAARGYSLVITDGHGGRSRSKRRRMQIVFHWPDQPSGEVLLDGQLLMEIPLYGEAAETRSEPKGKDSIFSRFLKLLRNIWRPRSFAMTAEQSEMVRGVLATLESEAALRSDGAAVKSVGL
jgi:hypothetical protein